MNHNLHLWLIRGKKLVAATTGNVQKGYTSATADTTWISWDDFRLVRGIAESGSLVGAAAALNLNHSTVFRRLGATARPGAVLATNTSYLDIDPIAAASGRAGDVIGLHN